MPEAKKRTLKAQLTAEFDWATAQRPDLTIVKIADGAPNNWEFLEKLGNGNGVEILDLYHAATHLKPNFQGMRPISCCKCRRQGELEILQGF